ncbi:glycosyltransferase [Lutimonas halocynthiae]|uniref:glycosyltransferase n=1 Tax=Lutimonas halocynthiae TaxID=1446477 RepID=UPI0025B44CCA|nr:glycosyltransferase [Lutimonas halocynthiae]MDN3644355.1 glycosyltransferase [Lutimonas halocynthiae]
MRFSIIIPVYNRPEELDELLQSIYVQDKERKTEIVVVEDGSEKQSSSVVSAYENLLNIKYCFKKNSGPGDSRNYGMKRASGDYFILLDSDCILPDNYLSIVNNALEKEYVDAYGGPDAAHSSFTNWQKAINYSMTSFLTTGGLRSEESPTKKFQLRSFNMGISKKAFALTGGFSKQRIGEDIDLNFKLLEKGCKTRLIKDAFVYHKRRTSLGQFYKQTRNFGAARPILNKMHPGSAKLNYWLPSFFVLGLLSSMVIWYFFSPIGFLIYALYFLAILIDSFVKNKKIAIALSSVMAAFIQFLGYGTGFLRSVYRLYFQRKGIKEAFPGMFA